MQFSRKHTRKEGREQAEGIFLCFPFVIFIVLYIFKRLACISAKNIPRAEFEVKELCAQYTTDVVATCAYGIRGNALQDPNCEFRRMGREIFEPTFWKNIRITIIFMLPRLAKFLKLG
jgi:hypothetical protein